VASPQVSEFLPFFPSPVEMKPGHREPRTLVGGGGQSYLLMGIYLLSLSTNSILSARGPVCHYPL
jgi:hypothetical protein